MRILNVVGARPNFVKIAPLLAEMRRREDIEALLVHTGQHYDREMSGTFLSDLEIPLPDFQLDARGLVRGTRLIKLERNLAEIMAKTRPDVVVVVGDVDSTLAGARAAHTLRIPVAHVEAGLRSFDRSMPEEINRIATDALTSLFLASESSAVANLIAEGHSRSDIFLCGNVMIDTLRRLLPAALRSTVLANLGLLDERGHVTPFVLATLHRAGTVDHPAVLGQVWSALDEISRSLPVLFAAHPRTRLRLLEAGLAQPRENVDGAPGIRVIPAQRYFDFLRLESAAALVLTDSGGVQEETTALGVPCLTLRNNTERPITISHGTNRLVGLEPESIVRAAHEALTSPPRERRLPPLWDGHSAERIVCALCSRFHASSVPLQVEPLSPNPPLQVHSSV